MPTDVREPIHESHGDVVAALDLSALEVDAVLVVPDKLFNTSKGEFAGYREDTQSLRVFLSQEGLKVQLATPPGAKAVSYEEHDAIWVLPLVVTVVGGTAANVLSQTLINWLQKRKKEFGDLEAVKLRYREGELDLSTGKLTVREVEGPIDAVIEAVIEARESLPPS